MKNSGNIVFGGFLLAAGILWLLKSLDLFTFYWADLFNYWYWFLIAAGVLLLISGLSNNRLAGSMAGVFLTLAIVGGVIRGTHREFRNLSPFEWQSRKQGDGQTDRKQRKSRRERRQEARAGESVVGNFGYDMQPGLAASRLNFTGGAGVFVIDGSTSRLFEANTNASFINYVSNIRHNQADNYATIDFRMDDGDINFDDKNGENAVSMQLNDSIRWDLSLKLGAGEGNFDLSKNRVEKFEMNAGAADVKLKLGDQAPLSKVDIKAGVASINIKVPKNVSVEVTSKGALNATDFEGFVQVEKDRYQSPGYDDSQNKISISYKGGMSSLKIEQY